MQCSGQEKNDDIYFVHYWQRFLRLFGLLWSGVMIGFVFASVSENQYPLIKDVGSPVKQM